MFKSLGAIKRRGIQGILETIGATDRTQDEEFELLKERFDEMVGDFNDLGMGLSEFVDKTRAYYTLNSDLAEVLDSYYNGNYARDWPGAPNRLRIHRTIADAKQHWGFINEVVRRSMAAVLLDMALNPARAFATDCVSDLNRQCDIRNDAVKDFDSYRRRLTSLQEGRSSIPPAETARLARHDADTLELQAKLERAHKRFDEENAKAKEEILKAKIARDELIELAAVTLLTCQTELMYFSTGKIEEILATVENQQRVQQIRTRIRNLIRQGGPDKVVIEATRLEKIFQLSTGKRVLSDFTISPEEQAKEDEEERARQALAKAVIDQEGGASGTIQITRKTSAPAFGSKRHIGASTAAPTKSSVPSPPPPANRIIPSAVSTKPVPAPPVKASATGSSVKSAFSVVSAAAKFGSNKSAAPSTAASSTAASPSASSKPALKPAPTTSISPAPVRSFQGTQPAPASTFAAKKGGQATSPSIPKLVAPAESRAPPPPVREYATALYDNVPDDADELSFRAGDRIQVIGRDDSGWWTGKLNNTTGVFPANYVRLD